VTPCETAFGQFGQHSVSVKPERAQHCFWSRGPPPAGATALATALAMAEVQFRCSQAHSRPCYPPVSHRRRPTRESSSTTPRCDVGGLGRAQSL